MQGFTVIDGVVAVVVIVSALLAYSRGLSRELLAIVGWLVAGVAAFVFAPTVEPLIGQAPYIGDFLGGSCELSIIVAFAAVFALALLIMSVFTPLFSGVVQRSALGGLDRALGFLFGVARGILLVAVALIVYERAALGDGITVVDRSRSAAAFAALQAEHRRARARRRAGLDRAALREPGRRLRRLRRPRLVHARHADVIAPAALVTGPAAALS